MGVLQQQCQGVRNNEKENLSITKSPQTASMARRPLTLSEPTLYSSMPSFNFNGIHYHPCGVQNRQKVQHLSNFQVLELPNQPHFPHQSQIWDNKVELWL